MNSNERVEGLRLADIFPLIEEKLKSGGEVSFKPHGISMLPLIRQGKDSVTLKQLKEEPKKLDVIFYRRTDGQFVLHRIVGTDKNGYILCGDNQYIKEYGVQKSQIIGIMTAVLRDGEVISCDDLKYRAYCKSLWLRRNSQKAKAFVKRALSKIKRTFIKR